MEDLHKSRLKEIEREINNENKELYIEVAMRAMQGILANPQWFKFRFSDGSFIKDAFEQADKFMEELKKRME